MSSRRGAGEENILAMLERDSARRPGSRMSGVRLASYGAAAALVGILAGGVAWLAYDNHRTAAELQFQHDLANNAAPQPATEAALPPAPPPAAVTAPAIEAPRPAVVVDESARPRDATVASAPPPLVMLPQHELAGTKAPTPAPAPRAPQESAPQPAPEVSAPPAQEAAPRTVQEAKPAKPAKAQAPAVAARPTAEKKKVEKTAKSTKPAPTRAKATAKATAKTTAKATAKTKSDAAARQRKTAAATTEPAVDSDVALISAIIQHSDRHRGEREAAACSGPKCPPKAERR
ncbi:hypothetical protein [Massilia sp. Leaf139]|uniref:hypothetical protein n=1 Tax=Massilia sp. Leaf139 TaxID=1736272 RepID=UPI000700E1AD|nr:hypothetical protein [Massilia sp. Leaf139]KQQ89185.1 hypothetical protein ASF77_10975 [Massilia sp. Leaf139]